MGKIGSGEILNVNTNHNRKEPQQHTESILNLNDCINQITIFNLYALAL